MEKLVCVITGGGSGIGLEAAKFMSKDKIIVISGRTASKLEKAVSLLEELGYEAYGKTCDTSIRTSVRELATYATSLGTVTNVINSAGLSPAMADPETILRVNALGTVYVNQEFSAVMGKGSVIVNVSSNSAYFIPRILASRKTYQLAEKNEEAFLKRMQGLNLFMRNPYKKAGMAYAMSKNFVIWYAASCAFEYGKRGIRVASISPGRVATDMGKLESDEGDFLLAYATEERLGTPEELGYAIATLADERNGYLSGVDILCDGGSIHGKKEFRRKYA